MVDITIAALALKQNMEIMPKLANPNFNLMLFS